MQCAFLAQNKTNNKSSAYFNQPMLSINIININIYSY